MIEIPLTNGGLTRISDHKQSIVEGRKFYKIDSGHVSYAADTNGGVFLHIIVMGRAPEGHEWDHIDGDGLNNEDTNLRLATRS